MGPVGQGVVYTTTDAVEAKRVRDELARAYRQGQDDSWMVEEREAREQLGRVEDRLEEKAGDLLREELLTDRLRGLVSELRERVAFLERPNGTTAQDFHALFAGLAAAEQRGGEPCP